MTYDERRRKYVVRWRENSRRRVKRFDRLEEAEAFEQSLQPAPVGTEPQGSEVAALAARLGELEAQLAATAEQANAPGDGVFAYETKRGTRYGFKFRQSDGTSSTRRGDAGGTPDEHAPALKPRADLGSRSLT